MIGVAIGPIVGSTIASFGSTRSIGWVAAVIIMLAAGLFHAAGSTIERRAIA
jgi:predicted MFS family arabinose efflux permease